MMMVSKPRTGCKFFYDGKCEHGLTHECPMYDDNWESCVDAENCD